MIKNKQKRQQQEATTLRKNTNEVPEHLIVIDYVPSKKTKVENGIKEN